jgi:hypothetical protein
LVISHQTEPNAETLLSIRPPIWRTAKLSRCGVFYSCFAALPSQSFGTFVVSPRWLNTRNKVRGLLSFPTMQLFAAIFERAWHHDSRQNPSDLHQHDQHSTGKSHRLKCAAASGRYVRHTHGGRIHRFYTELAVWEATLHANSDPIDPWNCACQPRSSQ